MSAFLLALPLLVSSSQVPPTDDTSALVFDRGDELGFVIPVDEELDFDVMLDVAVVGETGIGQFRLSAGVEQHRAGLGAAQPGKLSGKKVGWIRGQAMGAALNYELDHTIESRMLPQPWPRVIYRDTQKGSECRKREVMYGEREGKPMSWYRRDGHCGGCNRPEHQLQGLWPFSSEHHCKRCKRGEHRLWRRPTTQEVPASAVDMLSAIYLARALVQDGREQLEFSLLDKDTYWQVTMTRARTRNLETPAGTFRCVEVKLDPQLPAEKKEGRFRGLFGIHGTLSVWLHEGTGVPVEIGGTIPAGILDVGVALRLSRYRGTPEGFLPVQE
jgi:hypothetical protein